MDFRPIGYIKTDYNNLEDIPGQPRRSEGHCLVINKELESGLESLEKFKYIYVLYYLDRVENTDLTVTKEKKEVGLFATRSPNRPNPIGLSVVQLIGISENTVHVSGLDVLNGTPLLDIKPYIRELDMKSDANSGWLKKDNHLEDKVYLYTDGSCSGNPGPGGYAALIIDNNKEHEIKGFHPDTTNNRMELMAVIEGLKEIKKGSQVKLISDSNYVIKGLEEWVENWKKRGWKTASNKPVKNRDLWKELEKLADSYSIEYVKVKGHSGHDYNERVDSLAREQIEEYNKE